MSRYSYDNKNYIGTRSEWDKLSYDEKSAYKMVEFTDDYDISNLSKSIFPSLCFIGSVESESDLYYIENPKRGDVVVAKSNGNVYMWNGEEYNIITTEYKDGILPSDELNKTIELKDRKCPNCGAPLHKYDKYLNKVRCEYCDSIFSIEII